MGFAALAERPAHPCQEAAILVRAVLEEAICPRRFAREQGAERAHDTPALEELLRGQKPVVLIADVRRRSQHGLVLHLVPSGAKQLHELRHAVHRPGVPEPVTPGTTGIAVRHRT